MPHSIMSLGSRKEYLNANYKRYRNENKQGKQTIIDEFCTTTGHHRKSAIRLFNAPLFSKPKPRKLRGKTYTATVKYYLMKIWKILDYPCGQRLAPMLAEMVRVLERCKEILFPDEVKKKLRKVSSSTIDRLLRDEKRKIRRKLHGTTKPGSLLKKHIPVVLSRWNEVIPGFTELDLVAHNGGNSVGDFGNTLNITDLATGWTEAESFLGKAQKRVTIALDHTRKRLPFPLLGIDPDNGSEFINWQLYRYCVDDRIQFTRGRPGKKNDNAHIEEKNWTHIRKIVGYHRIETDGEIELLNRLYRGSWRLYENFFQPVMKLKEKIQTSGPAKRKYDVPRTPYQRCLEAPDEQVSKERKEELTALYETLNPAALKREIESLIEQLRRMIVKRKQQTKNVENRNKESNDSN